MMPFSMQIGCVLWQTDQNVILGSIFNVESEFAGRNTEKCHKQNLFAKIFLKRYTIYVHVQRAFMHNLAHIIFSYVALKRALGTVT